MVLKKKFIEPLDDTHSTEEQEQQASTMDYESLRVAAQKCYTKKPVEREVISKQVSRDSYITEYAKARANGVC